MGTLGSRSKNINTEWPNEQNDNSLSLSHFLVHFSDVLCPKATYSFLHYFCHSFVFSQLCAEVSEGLTNVSGLPVTASILSAAPCLPPGLSLSLTFIDSYRKVATGLCVTHAHTL